MGKVEQDVRSVVVDARVVAVLLQHRVDVAAFPPGPAADTVETAGVTAGQTSG
jgi:hypothetical protein